MVIRRADVASLLDHVEDNHGVYMTNRVLAVIRKMFNWAVDERGLLDASPVGRNMARGGEKARSRFLSVEEIRLLWPVLDQQAYPFGLFAKLLLLTGQRRNEVAAMQWAELNDDATIWIIPAERMESGRDHEVPLSTMAQDLLGEIPRVDDTYAFSTTKGRPVSGFSQAKKWIDRHIEAADRASGEFMEPWRYHDLRATVATHMAEALALPPHVVGAVLGHDPRLHAGITATYQRGSMHQAKRDALEAWGSLLHKVVTENG